MKVALVYDRVNKWGGAERVLLVLHEVFPDAPLYTSVYNEKAASWARVFSKVTPSFLQYFPFAKSRHDLYAPLMPFAFESFDFSKYDLVISVSSEAAKGIITGPKTLHINYCLTPTRYLWSGYSGYFRNRLIKFFSRPVIFLLRKWDLIASTRSDQMIAISNAVSTRISKFYGRKSRVIFPPVNVEKFQVRSPKFKVAMKNLPADEYFLIVSRLVPYKRVDLATKVFNKLNLPLVVIGAGSELKKLKRMSGSTIKFFSNVHEEDLVRIYKSCKAFIMPQDEDFGIAAVEAQAAGKPVIALKRGGAIDTIIDGKTGIFFEQQTVKSLEEAIGKLVTLEFDPADCILNSKRFSKEKFKKEFAKMVK